MPPQVATYGTLLSVRTALNSEIPINSLFTSHQTIRPSGIALGVHHVIYSIHSTTTHLSLGRCFMVRSDGSDGRGHREHI